MQRSASIVGGSEMTTADIVLLGGGIIVFTIVAIGAAVLLWMISKVEL